MTIGYVIAWALFYVMCSTPFLFAVVSSSGKQIDAFIETKAHWPTWLYASFCFFIWSGVFLLSPLIALVLGIFYSTKGLKISYREREVERQYILKKRERMTKLQKRSGGSLSLSKNRQQGMLSKIPIEK
jgi:hypothetical protein